MKDDRRVACRSGSGKRGAWAFLIAGSAIFLWGTLGRAAEGAFSASPWEGREVFERKGCNQCHAIHGKGGRRGPDLGEKKFYGTYLRLSAAMWNHYPKMAAKMDDSKFAAAPFDTKEMAQLVAFLSFQRYVAEPASASLGRKILEEKRCGECHKFGGKGGEIGPDISAAKEYLSPLRLAEWMWNHGPNMAEIFERRGIRRPRLKGDEIAALAAGIRSYMAPTRFPAEADDMGEPGRGEALIGQKGCLACHSLDGRGGSTAADFGAIKFNYSVTQIAAKMWNHEPEMWAATQKQHVDFPLFKSGEMADLIAYLYSLKLADVPGDPAEGERIVRKRGCLACHSLKGEGAQTAHAFSKPEAAATPMGMIAAMWNHAPEMRKKLAEKRLKWPELSDREMAHIYALVQTLPDSGPAKR